MNDNSFPNTTGQQPMRLVYLAFDSNDSRVLHRARTLTAEGAQLLLAAFHRTKMPDLTGGDWKTIDLGQTVDEAYWHRVKSVLGASARIWKHRAQFKDAEAIIGRNIEQLMLAQLVRFIVGKPIPTAYECLDIHGMMMGAGPVSRTVRAVERWCLDRCQLVVVSSSAFVDEYFVPIQKYAGPWQLIENKFAPNFASMARPPARKMPANRPIRIGWFGMLRCSKSFDMLMKIADARPDKVEIVIRGVPTVIDKTDFNKRVAERNNVNYGGPYKNPEDLAAIYESIDLTWMIDFFEEGFCSEWLLPNRLYESGFYGVPMLTREDTATATYSRNKGLGWTMPEPVVESVVQLVDSIDAGEYEKVCSQIAELPTSAWVENDEASSLLAHLAPGNAKVQ